MVRQSGAFVFLALLAYVATSLPARAIDPSQCLTRDRDSNGIADFWINSCNQRLNVKWFDEGFCKTGCGATVAAGGKESVTKAKGAVRWAALCPSAFS